VAYFFGPRCSVVNYLYSFSVNRLLYSNCKLLQRIYVDVQPHVNKTGVMMALIFRNRRVMLGECFLMTVWRSLLCSAVRCLYRPYLVVYFIFCSLAAFCHANFTIKLN